MKKKPKYRIIEVKNSAESVLRFYIQKRVWFRWVYTLFDRGSRRYGEQVHFSTLSEAEDYINYHLKFKPYRKIVKEIY